ncbi:ABC transporter substrate-binding protein [Heliorestis convoluta]|uniref:ABC transporter substrate-binding protein n=1 Tax=Heliorestis convoluta TaxID=356322 RepID=A0A5Q2N0K1_9FIRM|nr:ABC transporter substrate-binding protein [Heliorestis convoluta]QGG46792.1 ABC transporter substrate-binding protein [Heliorestis convoluta]
MLDFDGNYGQLNLLALLPCPVKVPFERIFNEPATSWSDRVGMPLRYELVSNANQYQELYTYLDSCHRKEDFPDMLLSSGFNRFYRRSFIEKFKYAGIWSAIERPKVNRSMEAAVVFDPDQQYTLLAINPAVLVVDLQRWGDNALPRNFGDVLAPRCRGRVVFRGHKDDYCEGVLLRIYKEYGINGIKLLAQATPKGMHPAEMAKIMGNGQAEGPVVAIMPLFFAKMIPKQDRVAIIWPDDGALANPVTILIKKEAQIDHQEIVDFFAGQELSQLLASVQMIPGFAQSQATGEDRKLYWIGWDFINSHDLGQVVPWLTDAFIKTQREQFLCS